MQRTAQKRSFLNKLREMTDVGGKATEKYFNPEFKEVMDQLREVDDGVRAIAAGEQVGEASAPSDAVSLKDLLKSVKSNLNRREYMKAVADLGRFHKKVFDIVHLLSLFKSNVDKVHEKFLFQDLDEDSKKHLQSFKDRWPGKAASFSPYFIKEANILDFFTNIATERGRALASWEKRYPNKVKKLKNDSNLILTGSEKLLGVILSGLKDMAKARSVRNPDNWIVGADKISNAFRIYDEGNNGFKKFYQDNVKDFLEKQEFMSPTKVDVTDKPQDLGQKNIEMRPNQNKGITDSDFDQTQTLEMKNKVPSYQSPAVPRIPAAPRIPVAPGASPMQHDVTTTIQNPNHTIENPKEAVDPRTGQIVDLNSNPYLTTTIQNPVQEPLEVIDPLTGEITTVTSGLKIKNKVHRKFMNSLESLAGESPTLMAAHISRYAKSIWSSDPETALKLFKIAKSIKG